MSGTQLPPTTAHFIGGVPTIHSLTPTSYANNQHPRSPVGRPSLGPRVALSWRATEELHHALELVAAERDLSMNDIITIAVERFIDTAESVDRLLRPDNG